MFNVSFFALQSIRRYTHFSLDSIKQQTISLMRKFNMPACYQTGLVNAFSLSNNIPKALQQVIDIQHCDNMLTGLKLFLFQQKQISSAVYLSSLQQLTKEKDSYIAATADEESLQTILQLHHKTSLEKRDVNWVSKPTETRIVCGMSSSLYNLISLFAQLCQHESFLAFYMEQYHLYLEMVATKQIPSADLRIFGIKLYNDIYAILRHAHPEIVTDENNAFNQKLKAIDSEYNIFLQASSSKEHFSMFYLALPREYEMLGVAAPR